MDTMNDELTFQEKLLKNIKKHKKKTKKHVFMVLPILLLILLVNAIYTPDVSTVADAEDDIFTSRVVWDILMNKMNDELTYQEKWLKNIKKHKKKTKKHVFMVLPILLLILLVNAIYTPDVSTVADADDDIFTATFVGDIMMGRNVEKVINQ